MNSWRQRGICIPVHVPVTLWIRMHHCWHICQKKRLFPHHSRQRLTQTTELFFPPAVSIWSSFPLPHGQSFPDRCFPPNRKSCCNRRRQWACTNCGWQLQLTCGRFGIFMRHRSKFWWVPVRNICWGFWCSCWVRPAAMPWKNPAIPRANAFYAATVPR